MKVCIAEKPSVAKDIAEVIGAKSRKDGYFEGNGYCVTWTFGHLCTQKEPHEYPALSLAKTKQVEELQQWAGVYPIWLSWKLDGLTLVLTYDNGNLVKILTRGNGNLGTNITFLKFIF